MIFRKVLQQFFLFVSVASSQLRLDESKDTIYLIDGQHGQPRQFVGAGSPNTVEKIEAIPLSSFKFKSRYRNGGCVTAPQTLSRILGP